MSSPDLFLINITLTPICTVCNQLAVPMSMRLGYGERRERKRDSLHFGRPKSSAAMPRGSPADRKEARKAAATNPMDGGALTTVEEEDDASLPAGGHSSSSQSLSSLERNVSSQSLSSLDQDYGPDRVFGPYAPGESVEMYHFSPEEAVHMQVKVDGLKWSTFARIQMDRRFAADVELHREVVCCDEADHTGQQLLRVSVHNYVIRDKPGDAGRDRRVSLSCPFWIHNMTGLPLSFCLGSPFADHADSALVEATPRMLQNVQMPDMMKHVSMPSSAAQLLPGMRMSGISPGMPSMPNPLMAMMTPRGGASATIYGDSDTMMAGLRAFHEAEAATHSVSHGLVEQPLQGGATGAAAGPTAEQDYPALMFSFTATKKRLLFVKVAGSQWSDAIPISDGGASGMVEITNQQGLGDTSNFLFQLSLTTSAHVGLHHRTQVLSFRPRFVIVNRLNKTVHYKQMGTLYESTLQPQHKTNFHWPDANAPFELCVRLLEPLALSTQAPNLASNLVGAQGVACYEWSGGCDISMLGESHLRLRALEPGREALILRIEVKNIQESLHVVLHPESERTPPFRVFNRSSSQIVISQNVGKEEGARIGADAVAPNTSIPYAWDNPLLSHLLSIQVAEVPGPEGKMLVKLDAIGQTWTLALPATESGPARNITATVKADGPTKILTLTDNVIMSLADAVSPTLEREPSAQQVEEEEEGSTPAGRSAARASGSISLSVSLDRVSVTLVDKLPQELLSATFGSVTLSYIRSTTSHADHELPGRFRSLDLSVKTFQLDNMLTRTPYPVAVYSSRALRDTESFLQFSVLEDLNDTVTNVPILKKVSGAVQDLELNLEGRLVLLIYLYYVAFQQSLQTLQDHGLNQQGPKGHEDLYSPSTARRVYFELFALPAVNVNFSFARRDLGDEETLAAVQVAEVVSLHCVIDA